MAKRGTKRVLEYARLAMGFANVRAGTQSTHLAVEGGAGEVLAGVGQSAHGAGGAAPHAAARRVLAAVGLLGEAGALGAIGVAERPRCAGYRLVLEYPPKH